MASNTVCGNICLPVESLSACWQSVWMNASIRWGRIFQLLSAKNFWQIRPLPILDSTVILLLIRKCISPVVACIHQRFRLSNRISIDGLGGVLGCSKSPVIVINVLRGQSVAMRSNTSCLDICTPMILAMMTRKTLKTFANKLYFTSY